MSFYRFARMEKGGGTRLYVQGVMESDGPWWTIDGTPNTANAKGFRRELEKHEGEELTVVIDSPGGSVDAGIAMYGMLRQRSGVTRCEIYNAASAATLVICGCDKGERRISPASLVMIHNPALIAAGDHRDMERAGAYLDKLKDAVINAYEEATGLSREDLSRMMDDETFLTAEEAVEKGFADAILEKEAGAEMLRGMTPREIGQVTMEASQAAIDEMIRTAENAERDRTEREKIALYASVELEKGWEA